MSKVRAEARLTEFIENPIPKAITLSGAWGVGKSHVWNRLIDGYATKPLRPRGYSSVSLFGLANIRECRTQLVANASYWADDENSASRTTSNPFAKAVTKAKAAGRGILSKVLKAGPDSLADISYASAITGFLEAQAFKEMRKFVVCLDDLERRTEQFELRQILGLVSELRDNLECSVVLILNSDALDDTDREELGAYREKVFDFDVVFAPTPAEIVAIAFPSDDPQSLDLRECAIRLGVRNIRVLRRISTAVAEIEKHLEQVSESLLKQIRHSASLLVWSWCSAAEGAPSFEFVKNYDGINRPLDEESEVDLDKRKWSKQLADYEYTSTDALDRVLCGLLENGWIDAEALSAAIAASEQSKKDAELELEFHSAFELYRNSFGDDSLEIARRIKHSLLGLGARVNAANASAAVSLLRVLEGDTIADELAHTWIAAYTNMSGWRNDFSMWSSSDIRDKYIFESLKTAAVHAKVLSTRQAFQFLSENRYATEEVEKALKAGTEDDFHDIVASISDSDTKAGLRQLMKILQMQSPSDDSNSACRALRAVLERVGSSSALNRRRVESLGIYELDWT